MAKVSAGILLYRRREGRLEVFLVHPGGPFWAKKDAGAWSIPKGEAVPGDDLLACARREFAEETSTALAGEPAALTPVRQAGGKTVHAFVLEGDIDAERIESNSFELEWPPRSGRRQRFPEVDRAAWFDLATARGKLNQGQLGLLAQLEQLI